MRIIFIASLLILCGCSETVRESYEESAGLPSGVWTFYDRKTNVRCYTVYDRGIACVEKRGHENFNVEDKK
jgi:hypothetical protein